MPLFVSGDGTSTSQPPEEKPTTGVSDSVVQKLAQQVTEGAMEKVISETNIAVRTGPEGSSRGRKLLGAVVVLVGVAGLGIALLAFAKRSDAMTALFNSCVSRWRN